MSDDEVVQIMSKLLLKGAKMLGKHCEKCGTPLFEYKGQIFCPKCDIHDKQEESKKTHTNQNIMNKNDTEKTYSKQSESEETTSNYDLKKEYVDIEKSILRQLKKTVDSISLERDIEKVKAKLLISNMLINLLLKLKKAGGFQDGRDRSGS